MKKIEPSISSYNQTEWPTISKYLVKIVVGEKCQVEHKESYCNDNNRYCTLVPLPK